MIVDLLAIIPYFSCMPIDHPVSSSLVEFRVQRRRMSPAEREAAYRYEYREYLDFVKRSIEFDKKFSTACKRN